MNDTPSKSAGTTHFGYRDVPTAEKQKLVGRVFTSVASKYDLMNDLMSFGIHRLWKRYFVATSGVRRGDRVLDLAGGTGDIAALLLPVVGKDGEIVVGDINAAMLGVGRDRLIDRGLVDGLRWTQLNAEALPFPDASFDAVTIAFGLRNVTDIDKALGEAYRVLKPGGRFYCLEFSKVTSAPGRRRPVGWARPSSSIPRQRFCGSCQCASSIGSAAGVSQVTSRMSNSSSYRPLKKRPRRSSG